VLPAHSAHPTKVSACKQIPLGNIKQLAAQFKGNFEKMLE
jgi:hypothetical protein